MENFSQHKKYKTMEEVAQKNFPDPERGKQIYMPGKDLIVPGLDGKKHKVNLEQKEVDLQNEAWKKTEAKAKEYNDNIYSLDPDYTSIEPIGSIVVRCFHMIPDIDPDTGLIKSNMELPVAEPTQNGVGVRATLDSPWKLSTQAVVVAIPPILSNNYNIGDTVQIINDARMAFKKSVDYPFELTFGYTIPSYHAVQPPTDPADKHFGYLRIDPYKHISAILKRAPKNEE